MITTRKALPEDADEIIRFQLSMALETENLELDPVTVQLGVNSVFSDPHRGTYYVAEIDGRVSGSLLITPEWSDWRNGTIIWIQSVYVLPEFRNIGVFKKMYRFIQKMVESDNSLKGIRLYVDKGNSQARKIYSKIGMNPDHYLLFEWFGNS